MPLLTHHDIGTGFPIVLGGSYLWGRDMWAPQIEVLSRHYRLILPELPGHDNDLPLSAAFTTPACLAREVGRLLDALDIRQYAVAGLSVGGMWAAELALQRPEQVRSLILMDTYLGAEPEASRQRYFGMLDRIEQLGCIPEAMAEQIVPLFFRPGIAIDDPIRLLFRQRLLSWPRERLLNAVVPLGRLIFGRPDRLGALKDLERETTLILNGEQDLPRPLSEAQQMARVIGCRLQSIPGSGHISTLENPAFTSVQLDAWLRQSLHVAC
ncbi:MULTISPECIES: alpha/beta fold hydrolase [Stenotrophomonas]|uniref:2-succinyl-6-hydroxy-2, 4-cyclohexadiene-1-carboxylate synthase n=1 Tax=Stenotrophomonas maltophilia TaxID=40324 RepID=A0AAD0FNU6_STEMA|nr:alpha/beta fold hydrolase [Stenotrophomonas maltophilia]AUI07493.1 2-succinyl-6-hydroxy-2,4-cyclohexadiene-1-carboxylate synthase [Stenotrophomonas maltophilia]MBA2131654.1 alpha/beta fold hydrolase [Stenotrophomonas maltophilia]MBH1683553.1 alpha/beta fold hydrolase [Stenotrophomonas maltophilia]MBH1875876.1 alpha/beta fold hydrolase [Stenotrophomonas maltophilia]